MGYFLLLFGLRVKSSLRSPVLVVSAAFFLALVLTLGAILPRQEQAGLRIGITARGETALRAVSLLAQNEDYQLLPYQDEQAMRRDILRGELHCGYLLADSADIDQFPITVIETKDSYMRPLIDQLVFAAYYEAGVPRMTESYLRGMKIPTDRLPDIFAELERTAKPLVIRLESMGGQRPALPAQAHGSMLPMLYAVMVSVFLAISLLGVLLADADQKNALGALGALRPVASVCAPVCADLLLHFAILLAADLLLGLLLGGQGYPVGGRLTVLFLLAAGAALLSVPASAFLRRFGMAVCVLLPLWLVVSIVCSGALVSPHKLPGGLSLLRFLSPAWYALRILGAV